MHTLTIGRCDCGRCGSLYDGICGFCEIASTKQDADPTLATLPINRALDLLLAELADDLPDPLAARLTLASIAADLCRLADEPVPAAVLAALDDPAPAPVRVLVRTTRRGSFYDWNMQFRDEPA